MLFRRLKQVFTSIATGVALATTVTHAMAAADNCAHPGDMLASEKTRKQELAGGICAKKKQIIAPTSVAQKRLAHIYAETVDTSGADNPVVTFFNKGGMVCLNESLGERTIGLNLTDNNGKLIYLNPDGGDELLSQTLDHEARHDAQVKFRKIYRYEENMSNIPLREYVIEMWLAEADARLSEVELSHRKMAREKGEAYYQGVVASGNMRMLEAYERTLKDSGNISKARQAAVATDFMSMAVRAILTGAEDYAQMVVGALMEAKVEYNPHRRAETLLDDATLNAYGRRSDGTNYMTPEFMRLLRQSFSDRGFEKVKQGLMKAPETAISPWDCQ